MFIPPVGLYVKRALERRMYENNDDDGKYSLEKELAYKKAAKAIMIYWMVAWGVMLGVVSYFWLVNPACARASARKDGAQRVLESLHSDAIRSANTASFSDYTVIPQRELERDSAHYAREIRHFIRNSEYKYLCRKGRVYQFDMDRWVRWGMRDAEVQQWTDGYKQAVGQLAMQRRIPKQK